MQNLKIDRLQRRPRQIDIAALDIIRDRERGVPRFNEFRRQYGLRQLTSFEDFINKDDLAAGPRPRKHARQDPAGGLWAARLRQRQAHHRRAAQRRWIADQRLPRPPNGAMVDNIEDLDTVVGYLAESTRPHGYAISETQFVVFILNASRRLYSDRFFTSSFRKEFYSQLGVDWVNNNGPYASARLFP